MAIPTYQQIMFPLLKFAGDKKEHATREAIDYISNQFNLTEEEKRELLPSGTQFVIDNRVGWARTYLTKAGLLESPKRSFFNITEEGFLLLSQNLKEINNALLKQYPSFVEFRKRRKENGEEETDTELSQTPQELIESGYQRIRQDLEQELLRLVKQASPKFFERLVVELLISMGYGGSRKDAGKAIGQSGDGGIDGIIKEDKLGLDIIFIQAKRWDSNVGSREIRDFVGSLVGQNARKGVIITTSDYSKEALDYAKRIEHKLVLINGEQLVQFMIENNIGVSTIQTYEIKRVDFDYFIEGD